MYKLASLLVMLSAIAPQAQVFQSGGIVPQHLTMWAGGQSGLLEGLRGRFE